MHALQGMQGLRSVLPTRPHSVFLPYLSDDASRYICKSFSHHGVAGITPCKPCIPCISWMHLEHLPNDRSGSVLANSIEPHAADVLASHSSNPTADQSAPW